MQLEGLETKSPMTVRYSAEKQLMIDLIVFFCSFVNGLMIRIISFIDLFQ